MPRQIVSDNLKAGITKACFYEPTVNRTYADMAAHYRTAIIPARPYKPRDKAKVEVGVQVVQRWILARLRNRRFFSLAELNRAIRELVDQLNDRPMRGWGTTRRALYVPAGVPRVSGRTQRPSSANVIRLGGSVRLAACRTEGEFRLCTHEYVSAGRVVANVLRGGRAIELKIT